MKLSTTGEVLPTAVEIANSFSFSIREMVDKEELKIINIENDRYRAKGEPLCETHAYCDPNELMLGVCQLLSPVLYEGAFTTHIDIVMEAWTLASNNHFKKIKE